MTTSIPTAAQLHAFVRTKEGAKLATLHRDKTFSAAMRGDRLWIMTANGEREVRSMPEILKLFASSGSFRPVDYRSTGTFNASYVLALIAAWQRKERGNHFVPAADAVIEPALSEQHKDRIRQSVTAAASTLDCSVAENRLRHGLEIKKKASFKSAWVGSVYWGRNAPGNTVEIAFDLQRLASRPGKSETERLGRWVRHTVEELENEPANNHSGDHGSWFRAGFKLDEAIQFFTRLAQQSAPLLHDHERWDVPKKDDSELPDDGAADHELATADASIEPDPPVPEQASIEHMIRMARVACEVSGQRTETINKTKNFGFLDDDDLRRYIAELIERQGRLCAISKLPLHFEGTASADADQLASLDRIDSSGHYVRGNLQVVCRFVNRWKGDGDNDNFLRLLKLVRGNSGTVGG